MPEQLQKKKHLTTFQIIILGFASVILFGAILLMLPVSSASGRVTPFNEALFTSASAVCVTGLVVKDTATYWSAFGQAVLLVLIQTGGMGVITVAAFFALISGKKISLMQRSTMQEAIAAPKVGGIVRLTGFIIKAAFIIELVGAAVLAPVFCRDFGPKGLWLSLFHAVSAFCNAGFDLMGSSAAPYASMTEYSAQPVVNIVLMLLIFIGGIGFLTWEDIRENKLHFKRYRMQSRVVLVTSGILILFPAVWFFFLEFSRLPVGERVLNSFFQSVTTRTAGFNTANLNALSGAGKSIMIVLMMIGGSPGSTAGGMKTTTAAVMFANAVSVFRRREDPQLFGRRIESWAIKSAFTILMMYVSLFFFGALIISAAEGLPMGVCLFETASAVGTVGLTLGITPELGILSQIVLIVLMFLGRVGGLTLIYAAVSGAKNNISKLPQEKIMVG